MQEVMKSYQATRSIEVLKIQNAARNSTEWFENVARYVNLPPQQFAYSLLTRSQRISHENLRLRNAEFVTQYERYMSSLVGFDDASKPKSTPPMFLPLQARGITLKNRVMVSPMATYSAVDGVPGDFHLMHYGARAIGGAAIVFTEMTCVTPEGRITPGCPGLWNDEQEHAWTRIVSFVHAQSDAKMALQLGHAGRKGSTRRAWDGMDMPLVDAARDGANWELMAPSALPYMEGVSQVPHEMTRADMLSVLAAFVSAAERGAQAGFDFYSKVIEFDERSDLPKPNGVWVMDSSESAEFVKLAETTYRDVNIGLANQFSKFAIDRNLDIHAVISASNSQPYSHIHTPGISVGGHCIPIYPQFYLWNDPAATSRQAFGVKTERFCYGSARGRRRHHVKKS